MSIRPHWLPEEIWVGKTIGQWPLEAFESQDQAERWAAAAPWQAQEQRYEPRRIFGPVAIPADVPTYRTEKVPATTKLIPASS